MTLFPVDPAALGDNSYCVVATPLLEKIARWVIPLGGVETVSLRESAKYASNTPFAVGDILSAVCVSLEALFQLPDKLTEAGE